LMLGPDFITDEIKVETCDHAVLNLKISYNNAFKVQQDDEESIKTIFSVPDFIGYTCSIIGSRIREYVAQCTFDQFHRHSNAIIEEAVFHRNPETGKINPTLLLEANNMIVSNVDVHSIEPADPSVLASLTKSVQMAIEISTKSIETSAKHEADYGHQKALGYLDIQKISDAVVIEEARKRLLETSAENAAIESTGSAIAEARAHAEKMIIEGESAVKLALLNSHAKEIEAEAELSILTARRNAEILFQREMTEIEIVRAKKEAEVEVVRMGKMIKTITPKAIVAMAASGPRRQVKLLQSLGIQSTLITDGTSPINLFQTAGGLVQIPPSSTS